MRLSGIVRELPKEHLLVKWQTKTGQRATGSKHCRSLHTKAMLKRDFHIFLSAVEVFKGTIHASITLTPLYTRPLWDPLGHLLFNNKLVFRKVYSSPRKRGCLLFTLYKKSLSTVLCPKGLSTSKGLEVCLSVTCYSLGLHLSLQTKACTQTSAHMCVCMCSHYLFCSRTRWHPGISNQINTQIRLSSEHRQKRGFTELLKWLRQVDLLTAIWGAVAIICSYIITVLMTSSL